VGGGVDEGKERGVGGRGGGTRSGLDWARAWGVRYVDAARSYGRAEQFLGEWLTSHESVAGDTTVGSKWGYRYTGEWRLDVKVQEVKDLSVENLRRQFAESRSFLANYLRLYQIHSATLESEVLDDRDVLTELRRIKDSGLAIGLTVTGPLQSATIARALELDLFDTVQATWNLLERSATEALES